MDITQGQHWRETVIETDAGPISVAFVGRESERYTQRYFRKTRLYPGSVEKRHPELAELSKALPAPKQKGEDPANDRAYADYNRAYIKAARTDAAAVLKALLEAGILSEAPTLSFSRYAGCSCPCSPGFIVNGNAVRLDGKPVDLSLA